MTTNDALTLLTEAREALGKRVRFLRRQGLTPINLYGRGMESASLQVATKDLEQALRAGARSSLVTLSVNGGSHQALLRQLQRDPVSRAILHADFYRVEMDRPIETRVPIHLVGEAPAARLPDALVTQVLREITIESLPTDIPASIEVDISSLAELETAILVRDIPVPAGVTVLTDPEQMVVRAVRARAAEEAVPEEAAEAERPAEGEGTGAEKGAERD